MLRRCHLAMNFHSTSSTETATQLQHWGTLCAWPSWHRHKDIHALVQFFQGTYSDVFSIFLVIDLRVLVTTFRALDLTCLGLETFTLGFGADVLTTTRWSQVADAVSKESCRSPERILGRCAHDPGGRLWMARWLSEHEGLVDTADGYEMIWKNAFGVLEMLLVLDPGRAGLPEKWVELECASIYTIDLSVPEVKERDVSLKNGRLDFL